VFVCAITLGIRRPDIRGYFEQRSDDIIELVKLGIFVVFGGLLMVDGLFADGWAPVAVKGVATMTFSLLVLGSEVAERERIFNLAALAVLCSIILHGLSDTPGGEWMARRAEAEAREGARERVPSAT
jgi:hypothetical protein